MSAYGAEVHGEDASFTAAARAGEVAIQQCVGCGHCQLYGRMYCTVCGAADPPWRTASGQGTVYSFTVVRRAPSEHFRGRVPYVIALVNLVEGPRLMGIFSPVEPGLADAPSLPAIGMKVETTFRFEGDTPVAIFRPIGTTTAGE